MGYSGPYSLAARCLTEFLTTWMAVGFGNAIIANEVLPRTKGHELGFGWVAFGYGLAFFVPKVCWNFISAHGNPGMILNLLVQDKLDWGDFFALAFCQLAGGIMSGFTLFVYFAPHLKTVPQPPQPGPDPSESLLEARDALPPGALALASYVPAPVRYVERFGKPRGVGGVLADMYYYFGKTNIRRVLGTPTTAEALEPPSFDEIMPRERLRRNNSIQVSDLQNKLKKQDLQKQQPRMQLRALSMSTAVLARRLEQAQERGEDTIRDLDVLGVFTGGEVHMASGAPAMASAVTTEKKQPLEAVSKLSPPAPVPAAADAEAAKAAAQAAAKQKEAAKKAQEVEELYKAAVVADQAAKLVMFCTRPAIYTPVFNFIQEFFGSMVLFMAASLFEQRGEFMREPLLDLYVVVEPFYIALLICVMVLGLGGVTGFAANPARDLGPRIAHFLLPIPGKGSSEWSYAWVPVVGPFLGGAAAGGLIRLLEKLNQPESYPPSHS